LLPDITAFMQTFIQQHYNPQALIATAGPDLGSQFVKAVGLKNTEGVFVPNGWYPAADNFDNATMVKAYIARYGGTPDAISSDVAEAYAVGQVFAQAAAKIHSIDNAKLITVLHSGATFNSVQGPVRFDPTGQNVAAEAYLFQWQKGKFLRVFPAGGGAVKPEFPKAHWH
jgi:branched-chain amino acid transport system substrate-binding protein